MRIRTIAVVGIGLAIALAALTWLDIRLMSSRTAADATVAASHRPAGAVPAVSVTRLSVEGSDRLPRRLADELSRALDGLPGVGAVEVSGSTAAPGSALITVRFVERQLLWTLFYARSQLHVHVAYASNGDTSFDDGSETTHFTGSTGEPPTVQFLADYALADVSWGLISKPGYQAHLAEQIASRVKGSIGEQIKGG